MKGGYIDVNVISIVWKVTRNNVLFIGCRITSCKNWKENDDDGVNDAVVTRQGGQKQHDAWYIIILLSAARPLMQVGLW